MNRPVYMDHHSTTPMDPIVLDAMLPYMTEMFGNPSSMDHTFGHAAMEAVESARSDVAELVGANADEITFTSGATEADNLAIYGTLSNMLGGDSKPHMITCTTEHKAVLDTVSHMEDTYGIEVTRVPVSPDGIIDMTTLEESIRPHTALISVMVANNEIGTIPDICGIGKLAHDHNILFHTDAAQAAGHIPLDVKKAGIDLMSMSAHKMYGPKGIGALYASSIKPAVHLNPLIHGGGQEGNRRSGTLNVPCIVGYGRAAALARQKMREDATQNRRQARAILDSLSAGGAILNGHPKSRLAHNLNVRFASIEGKAIINTVSDRVAISAGSACTTQTVEPSHVLLAIGLSEEEAHQSIRLGLGRSTTDEEASYAADAILDAVHLIERMS